MTIKAKKSKINLREKLAELLNFRQIRDRLDGLGLYLGKDRTNSERSISIRGSADIDGLHIAEISAVLGGNVVDVFIYDTNNDSDGGKWRERTQHTSWYNEELNTATRGSRREFPAVAVIIAEADKVTIYDGDDPDLPMWMVFEAGAQRLIGMATGGTPGSITCINAFQGEIAIGIGAGSGRGLTTANLIAERAYYYSITTGLRFLGNITERNDTKSSAPLPIGNIVSIEINDVAMTVLPNAPIDANTGLPVPTIAVATGGGVSVIKDDGSVVNIGYSNSANAKTITYIGIEGDVISFRNAGYQYNRFTIPSSHIPSYTDAPNFRQYDSSGAPALIDASGDTATMSGAAGSDLGLSLLDEDTNNFSSGMIAYTTSTYNTGWMPGDIKLAALSDTKIEKVGVDESTELISNNKFGSGTEPTGWEKHLGTSSVVANQAVLDGSGVTDANLITEINCEVGKRYEFKIDSFRSNGSNSYNINVSTGSGSLFHQTVIAGVNKSNTTMETTTIQFVATQETHYVGVKCNGNPSSAIITIDNAYVKQTGELITNGTFDNGTTGWTEGASSDISVDAGRLKVLQESGSSAYGYQLIQTQPGKKYILTADFESGLNVGAIRVSSGDEAFSSANLYNTGYISTSFVNATFTATTDSAYIAIQSYGATGGYVFVDNISVRLAEPDRSVNDNGLQVFGEIDKTPVASGADLVAYSGFSADNYLMQPYNSDLDFGTGDFCVMGWAKISNTSAGIINIMRNGDSQAKSWRLTLGNANGDIVWQRPDSSAMITFSSSAVSGSFAHYCITRRSSTIYFYINGKQITFSATGNSGDNYTSDNSVLKVYGGGSTSSSQYISLWRISATAPTAEQIAKIYRDEKVLFQDGAQATLYGTSDAVTALAYDDKTELLHVGTASGRSDFAGLRRINNTTSAVTTAISANNKLIAEQ